MRMLIVIACPALVLATAGLATAESDEPPALFRERGSLVALSLHGGYRELPGAVHAGVAGLSSRAVVGKRLGAAFGLDLEAGASRRGPIYGVELYPLGAALRTGDAGAVTLAGGAGVNGARGVIPAALTVPVELRIRQQLGALRLGGWAVARRAALSPERRDGSSIDHLDELELGVSAGWGRQLAYWPGSSAGSGGFVAMTYRELLGQRVLGLSVGLELAGGQR